MDLLACSSCGTRVAGPAQACPVCRGPLLSTAATTWIGALSADGRWRWDGSAWHTTLEGDSAAQVVAASTILRGECKRCGAPLGESSGSSCKYCRAPLPVLAMGWPPLPMQFVSEVASVRTELASTLPPDLGRLLTLQCPGCGHRDFEAKSFNRGPFEVRCRRCGSAISL